MSLSNVEVGEIQEYNQLAWRADKLKESQEARLNYLSVKWANIDLVTALAETVKADRLTHIVHLKRYVDLQSKFAVVLEYARSFNKQLKEKENRPWLNN